MGANFLKNTLGSKKLDNADLKKYAPNIVDGVEALKELVKFTLDLF